jgi:cytochrome c
MMERFRIFLSFLALGLASPALASPPDGDAAKGKLVFLQCQACHAVQSDGPVLVGPDLAGVYGRKAGSVPGYEYSAPLQKSRIVWTSATLNTWLINPAGMVPGTKMAYVGMPRADLRADVIAYLAGLE